VGVDPQVLRFLLAAKRARVSFETFLMVGRQTFLSIQPSDLHLALRQQGLSLTVEDAANLLQVRDGYVDPLLELLGANRIESLDYSSDEQASIVHDLNQPIPSSLREVFSCVFDGGTIEHVFNFPEAMKNCMAMVSIGGHLLVVTTANNFVGHGFYQFSPELYYRVLSEQNGFVVEEMILCETDRGAAWYEVADPRELGRRVEWVNSRPTYLMVRARKLRRADIFSVFPQQSDYAAAWSPTSTETRNARASRASPWRFIPEIFKRPLRRLIGHKTPGAFRRVP
jgi:hypothetical protein